MMTAPRFDADTTPMDTDKAARDIATGRRTIETEVAGLNALAASMDENFARAVATIQAMKDSGRGRLIVAGIGKSGHIAKKLAATFASTGTPAFFVHPGEASHGDLGMVTEDDIVLLLSNSGGSAELSDLIHYTRRFGITLIAVTSKADSALAKHADQVLLLPQMPEACPIGMAPTTSTTMTLALGDAIAVALLERMGLSKDDFKVWHPGGKLGQRLQKVSALMHAYDALPLIDQSATMDQAILMLSAKNLGVVLALDSSKKLAGIITDGDLKRHMGPDLLSRKVAEIMSKNPRTIAHDALAVEAVDVMTKTPGQYLTSLIVVDDENNLTGLIRLQDCLQAGIV